MQNKDDRIEKAPKMDSDLPTTIMTHQAFNQTDKIKMAKKPPQK